VCQLHGKKMGFVGKGWTQKVSKILAHHLVIGINIGILE